MPGDIFLIRGFRDFSSGVSTHETGFPEYFEGGRRIQMRVMRTVNRASVFMILSAVIEAHETAIQRVHVDQLGPI